MRLNIQSFALRKIAGVTCSAVIGCYVFAQSAYALPQNGQVINGNANFQETASELIINQNSALVEINWDTFDVSLSETVQFNQPNSSAIAINHVLDVNPSVINGSLLANGRVVIRNQAGITFGNNAYVNVGGLVATTSDIAIDEDLIKLSAADSSAIIENLGQIEVSSGGFAILHAPQINNAGSINTTNGQVVLNAADTLELNYGTGQVLIDASALENSIERKIDMTGQISNKGGSVVISAHQTMDALASMINLDGAVDVAGVTNTGQIDIYSEGNLELGNNASLTASGGDVLAIANNVAVFKENASIYNNGGFVEVSGYNRLHILGSDIQAQDILFDPENITVGFGSAIYDDVDLYSDNPGLSYTIQASTLEALTGNVNLEATNDIIVTEDINLTNAGQSLTLSAGDTININGGVSITTTDGDVFLRADHDFGAGNDGVGSVAIAASSSIHSGTGRIHISAAESVRLGMLTTSSALNDAVVITTGGTIHDDSANYEITATNGGVILTAGDIGTTVNHIDVSADHINATATAGVLYLNSSASLESITNVTGAATELRGHNINISGSVITNGGDLTVHAVEDLNLGSSATVQTAGGDIYMEADRDIGSGNDGVGHIHLGDTGSIDSGYGKIQLISPEQLTLGRVYSTTAAADAIVINVGGDIIDNHANDDIIAENGGIIITAAGVGGGLNGAIEIRANELSVNANGEVDVVLSGNATLKSVTNASANMTRLDKKASGELIVDGAITLSGGDLFIRSSDDLSFTAAANMQTNNGNVELAADYLHSYGPGDDGNGAITFDSATQLNAGTGTVSLTAAEDITFSRITSLSSANNAVVITSTAGALFDGNASATEVSAVNGQVHLTSRGSVGGSAPNYQIEVDSPEVYATSETGAVRLTPTSNATVFKDLSSVNGFVKLETTSAVDINVDGTVFGKDFVQFNTKGNVNVLAGANISAEGYVTLASDFTVSWSTGQNGIGSVSVADGAQISSNGGRIYLTSGEDILFNGQITSLNQNIYLRAANDIIFASTADIATNGDLEISADHQYAGALSVSATLGQGSDGLGTISLNSSTIDIGTGKLTIRAPEDIHLSSIKVANADVDAATIISDAGGVYRHSGHLLDVTGGVTVEAEDTMFTVVKSSELNVTTRSGLLDLIASHGAVLGEIRSAGDVNIRTWTGLLQGALGSIISDSGDITLVGGYGVNMNGTITAPGNISILSNNKDLILNAAINSGGYTLIQGMQNDVILSNTITAADYIEVNAAENISLTAAADLVNTNPAGLISLTADKDLTAISGAASDNVGNISMADGASVNAGAGQVALLAPGDITLSYIESTHANLANDAINVTSTLGSIDDNHASVDLVALNGVISLNAATGIGMGNQIEMRAHTVNATNSTSGDLRLSLFGAGNYGVGDVTNASTTAGDDVVIDGYQTPSSSVSSNILNIRGNISSQNAIYIRSANDITLEATADLSSNGTASLEADWKANGTAGDGIGSITMADGARVTANPGKVILKAAGDITHGILRSYSTDLDAISITSVAGDILNASTNWRSLIATAGGVELFGNEMGQGRSLKIDAQNLSLTANGKVSASLGGNITLNNLTNTAVGERINLGMIEAGGITIDGTVSTNGGLFYIESQDHITLADGAQILTNGGNIRLYADHGSFGTANDGVGAITMGANSIMNVGSGVIYLKSSDDIGVTGLTSTSTSANAIDIVTTAGRIYDAYGSSISDVSAVNGTVNLIADGNIGEDSNNWSIDTQAARINASSTNGYVRINTHDSVSVFGDISANNRIFIDNWENITIDGTFTTNSQIKLLSKNDVHLTSNAVLNSGTFVRLNGIGETIIDSGAQITSAQSTDISPSERVTLGGQINAGDFVNITSSGDVNLTSTANIQSSTGNILIEADGWGSDSVGHLHMADGAIINAGANKVILSAAEDITLGSITTTSTAADAVAITTDGAVLGYNIDGNGVTTIQATSGGLTSTSNGFTGVGVNLGQSLNVNAQAGDIMVEDFSAVAGNVYANNQDQDFTLYKHGDITLNGMINSMSGNRKYYAKGGNIISDGKIYSIGGSVTLEADGDILLNATHEIGTDSGDITIIADKDSNGVGAITFHESSLTRAVTGKLFVQSAGDILLAGLSTLSNAVDAAQIISTAGAILDNGDSVFEVTANNGTLTLEAANNIGMVTAGGKWGLEVSANQINATSHNSDIRLDGLNSNTTLNDLSADKSIRIVNISANPTTFNGTVNAGTHLTVSSRDDIIVGANANINTGGNVILSADFYASFNTAQNGHGNLNIHDGAQITAGNNMLLTATEDVSIDGQITATSNAHDLNIHAGRDILLGANATVNTSAAAHLVADSDKAGVQNLSDTPIIAADSIGSILMNADSRILASNDLIISAAENIALGQITALSSGVLSVTAQEQILGVGNNKHIGAASRIVELSANNGIGSSAQLVNIDAPEITLTNLAGETHLGTQTGINFTADSVYGDLMRIKVGNGQEPLPFDNSTMQNIRDTYTRSDDILVNGISAYPKQNSGFDLNDQIKAEIVEEIISVTNAVFTKKAQVIQKFRDNAKIRTSKFECSDLGCIIKSSLQTIDKLGALPNTDNTRAQNSFNVDKALNLNISALGFFFNSRIKD